MAVLPTGIGPVTGGYQIERSLRFNSADSAYLNRTPASASNRETWTWSGWVKRTTINNIGQNLFSTDNGSSTTFGQLFFSDNVFEFNSYASSAYQWRLITTQVWRDLSAWYHIVAVVDTTQATSSNRVKLYVNGVQITAFSTATYPSQGFDGAYNLNQPHYVGSILTAGYLNGYLTEVNFIDGQALTPSDFGETDSATGVWKPKAYSGTYGTNGFELNFSDNSNTTAATLGKDSSGNGNNWTPNNFSVTAGAGNDSMVDSPTSYGTDTGVGGSVRGNYATWNPLATTPAAPVTFSNGNLDVSFGSSLTGRTQSTLGVSSGKWYAEITVTAASGTDRIIGIVTPTTNDQPGYTADSYGYYGNGQKITNNALANYGASYTTNDVIGIALDLDAGTITFYKNNTSQGQAFSGLSGTYLISVSDSSNAGTCSYTANFGQRAFAYTAPSGFKALCTTNLPTPTIGATSTTQANDYFNAVTYTGNGTSLSVTGVGFQPDLIWIKDRSNARAHVLQNAIAGFSQYLQSNATDAETTASSGVTAVGSDGFTVGTQLAWNSNTETYVAWNWNAGGSNATNTSGTITSTVRANTTSGFSIVTYTGTGSNATVGHGLGVAPSMVIVKCRNNAGQWWPVWHTSLTSGAYILALQRTDAQGSYPNIFNSTIPTSSVFSVGTSGDSNGSTFTYVAYCFAPVAGYSAFGSYTGNGSTDGVFVYTGFRPSFILTKRTDSANYWMILDDERRTYNPAFNGLYPNLSDAEGNFGNSTGIDFLSNGFKLRDSVASVNASGGTYIYMAIAESPFKYSLGR
jgi:hypothetical protein